MRRNLNKHFSEILSVGGTGESAPVNLGNVAFIESLESSPLQAPQDKILFSVVNIQEEATLRNLPGVRVDSVRDQTVYKNPPVHLNIFLLVTANYASYNTALRMLSLAIAYFQANKSFSFNVNPILEEDFTTNAEDYEFNDEDKRKLNVNLELMSLTFEQINHLWGALGGKQIPFALYKVRVVEIELDKLQKEGPIITEIQNRLS